MKEIINIPSFCLYTSDFIYGENELTKYGLSIYNKLSEDQLYILNRFTEVHFLIYCEKDITNHYSIAKFKKGSYSSIEFNVNKAQGETGIRTTDKLKEILLTPGKIDIKNIIRKELNNYFGKNDCNKLSSYKLRKEFIFDLVRIKDGLKAIDLSKNTGYQSNNCDVGSDININDFARSLDSRILPYHTCILSHELIERALLELDVKSYSILSVFYFPERKSKYPTHYKYYSMLKDSTEKRNYSKAWRFKEEALNNLISNILYLEDKIV